MPQPEPSVTPWRQVIVIVGGLAVLMVVLLSAFALPSAHSGPHDVPLVVAGEPVENDAFREQLEAERPGAFAVTAVDDAERARELILDREVYGAVVLDDSAPTMLIASAASPAVADTLRGLAAQLSEAGRTGITVEDIRPLPDEDPRGAGFSAGALPLALGGWIGAVVLLQTISGMWRQAAAALAFAAVAGLGLTAFLRYVVGTFDEHYWATSAAAALGIVASAWTILGLRAAFGNAGLGLGAVLLVLLGNPLSGVATAPELLPTGWGSFGQLLPPGATGNLLRSVAFFDGAGAARPALILTWWLGAGVVLYLVGVRRSRRRERAAEATARSVPEPAPST